MYFNNNPTVCKGAVAFSVTSFSDAAFTTNRTSFVPGSSDDCSAEMPGIPEISILPGWPGLATVTVSPPKTMLFPFLLNPPRPPKKLNDIVVCLYEKRLLRAYLVRGRRPPPLSM